MNPHRPCANVGNLWILSAPLRMSKAFLRYSFSIVRAASMQKRRCRNPRCDARALFTTFAPWPCTIGFRHLCQQLPPAPRARPARPRRRPRPPPPPKPSMGELPSEHLSAGTATSAYCCSMPASRITLRASGTLNLSLADFRNIDAHQKPWRDNETFGKWRDKIANSVPPVTGPVWMAVSDTLRDQVSTLRGDQVSTLRGDQVIWRLAVLDPT